MGSFCGPRPAGLWGSNMSEAVWDLKRSGRYLLKLALASEWPPPAQPPVDVDSSRWLTSPSPVTEHLTCTTPLLAAAVGR